MKKLIGILIMMVLAFAFTACAGGETPEKPVDSLAVAQGEERGQEEETGQSQETGQNGTQEEEQGETAMNTETGTSGENTIEMNALGGMSPEDALEYMKTTKDLVIVDVAATRWYDENHFEGAMNIPIEELGSEEEDAMYMEIPSGRPVVMHCRLGMIVPGAYERVLELRDDIPEISYIDGKPPFDEYNEWLKNQ
ncbi:MAG: rhodanese-like domain-containing protein [Butyrivibrio sp.]|nr:rhodanese-like domain-containing protein [Butyrivibrio sp.]